ncbi:MAG: FtsQ-type POTRA domain-containing protein [Armatimonadetes bacterium]|nr:FtsQ-type POTRA domain-containing protein [Candidatus Hippobium faecium]
MNNKPPDKQNSDYNNIDFRKLSEHDNKKKKYSFSATKERENEEIEEESNENISENNSNNHRYDRNRNISRDKKRKRNNNNISNENIWQSIKVRLIYFLIFLATILILSAVFLFTFPTFNIEKFEVTGVRFANVNHINEQISSVKGKNIFLTPTPLLEYKCSSQVEIIKTTITKKLPNKLIVKIEEQKPITCIQAKNSYYIFNLNDRCFHIEKTADNLQDIPIIINQNPEIDKNIIDNKTSAKKIKNLDQNLYYLAKLCSYNKLDIQKLEQDKKNTILYTDYNTVIKFHNNISLIDSCYFLKKINEDQNIDLSKFQEIDIFKDDMATVRYKQ